ATDCCIRTCRLSPIAAVGRAEYPRKQLVPDAVAIVREAGVANHILLLRAVDHGPGKLRVCNEPAARVPGLAAGIEQFEIPTEHLQPPDRRGLRCGPGLIGQTAIIARADVDGEVRNRAPEIVERQTF